MTPQERSQNALAQELAKTLANSLGTLPQHGFAARAVETLVNLSQHFHPPPTLETRHDHFVFVLPEAELALHPDGRLLCRTKDGVATQTNTPEEFLRRLILRDSPVKPTNPTVEIRPYGPFECPIDEVVAEDAHVTVRRTKKREFSVNVNGTSFTVSNDVDKETLTDQGGIIVSNSDDQGDRLALTCNDPHHNDDAPGQVSVVPTNTDQVHLRGVFQVEEIHATSAYLHIEQMSQHDYWMAVGNMSFHFHPDTTNLDDGRERNEVKLTLDPPQDQSTRADRQGQTPSPVRSPEAHKPDGGRHDSTTAQDTRP